MKRALCMFLVLGVAFAQLPPPVGSPGRNYVRSYDTIVNLLSGTPARSEYVAIIKGYLSVTNRDGFPLFYVPDSTDTPDNVNVWEPYFVAGRWFRLMGINSTNFSTITNIIVGGGFSVNIQTFTNAGSATWTNPPGSIFSYIMVVGGGLGGRGGGMTDYDSGIYDQTFSGYGGGGGAWSERWMLSSVLASSQSLYVGSGSFGGLGATSAGSNGAEATNASGSFFGASALTNYLYAGGATNGPAGGYGQANGGTGSSGSFYTGPVTTNSVAIGKQATGGGAGGVSTTTSDPGDGEGGGVGYAPAYGTGSIGRAPYYENGTNGVSFGLFGLGTGGGGGGSYNIDTLAGSVAGNGGNGAYPGGGGGGGGLGIFVLMAADIDGGNGGRGANGFVGVVTFYLPP